MDNRELAKQLKENKQHDEAAILFKNLWEDEKSHWDGWNYAHCLYLQGLLNEAFDVSFQIYKDNTAFLYNRNLLVRIINDKYFKTTKENYTSEEINSLFDYVDMTYEILPNDKKMQIEFSVFRTIKIAKKHSNKMPYERVLKVLSYLEIDNVSDQPYSVEIRGKSKEIQSNKETYYAYKTKALLSQKEYEACIECCDEAYEKIQKFHHDNDIWLSERKMQSIAALGDLDTAISNARQLILLKNSWFLKYSLAQLLSQKGSNEEAIVLLCRAAHTRDPIEMKVNLLVQLGDLIDEKDVRESHYLLAKSIRLEQDWSIPNELQFRLNEVVQRDVNLLELKNFWLKKIQEYYGSHFGKIEKILDNTSAGFIKENGRSYYFKTNNVINGKVRANDVVTFVLVDSWDRKKEMKSHEADYILIQKKF